MSVKSITKYQSFIENEFIENVVLHFISSMTIISLSNVWFIPFMIKLNIVSQLNVA